MDGIDQSAAEKLGVSEKEQERINIVLDAMARYASGDPLVDIACDHNTTESNLRRMLRDYDIDQYRHAMATKRAVRIARIARGVTLTEEEVLCRLEKEEAIKSMSIDQLLKVEKQLGDRYATLTDGITERTEDIGSKPVTVFFGYPVKDGTPEGTISDTET